MNTRRLFILLIALSAILLPLVVVGTWPKSPAPHDAQSKQIQASAVEREKEVNGSVQIGNGSVQISLPPLPRYEPKLSRMEPALPLPPLNTGSPLPSVSDTTSADESDCRARNAEMGIIETSSTGPCIELGKVINNLKHGSYKFNKPSVAILEESFRLRLVLLTAEGQEADFNGLPGKVETRDNKPFAQFVEATLTGEDFEISPAGAQARTATIAKPVEWEWRVKPTSSGKKSLTVDVAANIQIGPNKNRVQITTLHESIEIQVTAFQRLQSYLAGVNGMIAAVTAALTSIAGLIGFVPKIRQFFKDNVLTLLRPKRPKRRRA